jgi:hypothetical protein
LIDLQLKEVFIDKDFTKNKRIYTMSGFPFAARFLGFSLATVQDKDAWRKQRANLNPAFHRM